MTVAWEITGIPEFEAGLAERMAAAAAATVTATQAAGQVVRAGIAATAPKQSGSLAGSIKVITAAMSAAGADVEVGPTVVYGRRVQLGYRKRPGRGHNATPAHPYLQGGELASMAAVGTTYFSLWGAAWVA